MSTPDHSLSSQVFRPCAVIPTYNNPMTVRHVVEAVRDHIDDIILVDDGSDEAGRAACEAVRAAGLAEVIHHAENGGKGAAVLTGLRAAQANGFTHALQIDADGQHATDNIPTFIEASRRNGDAFVIGYPEYDASVPTVRLRARKITNFWVNLEVGGRDVIQDAMIGFRIYPVETALQLDVRGRRMDFDIEIAVRMAWAAVPIVNLPVPVRYPTEEEGGVSHFQPILDNIRFIFLHARLCTTRIFRGIFRTVGLLPR